jgi:AcrR family transcriptional regulator
MSRWEPNARARLENAAMTLYLDRGFEQTTVADIAERAGLTERTFFRYFSDKREVLFWGAGNLLDLLVRHIDTDPDAAPLDIVASALEEAGALLSEHRDRSRERQQVIDANPELKERELIKLASWATTMSDALRQRGVADPIAKLASETGIAVFRLAFERWVYEDDPGDLNQLIRESFAELRKMTAPH